MIGRRKTLGEKISATIRAEFVGIIAELEEDREEYRHRLKRKEEAWASLESAQAEVERLHLRRIELKKRFWEAYYEEDETALSNVTSEEKPLERAVKRAERSLRKARARFNKADFDEVEEGFALKAKANIAEDEVKRRLQVLEETVEEVLTEVRGAAGEVSQALRDEYKEPNFDTAEEQNAHVRKMIEVLGAVAQSYDPRQAKAVSDRDMPELPSPKSR
jgi:transposase